MRRTSHQGLLAVPSGVVVCVYRDTRGNTYTWEFFSYPGRSGSLVTCQPEVIRTPRGPLLVLLDLKKPSYNYTELPNTREPEREGVYESPESLVAGGMEVFSQTLRFVWVYTKLLTFTYPRRWQLRYFLQKLVYSQD